MPETAPATPSPRCPDCQGPVHRAHRLPQDRTGPGSDGLHRFRCASAACGWHGLLRRSRRRRRPALAVLPAWRGRTATWGLRAASWAAPLRRAALGLGLGAAVAMPLLVAGLVGLGVLAGPRAAAAVPAGASHDGLPLDGAARSGAAGGVAPLATPVGGDASAAPLAQRRGCVWGQPGRMPYQGTTEQALEAAGLPPEVVREVAALRQAGRKTGRLEIRTGSIRVQGDGRTFDPRAVALSFGRTLCMNSRVNFAPGHVELADLYEVRDAQGRRHAVMVPDVCGNVSVLRARGERGLLAGLADVLAERGAEVAGMAVALAEPGDGDGPTAAVVDASAKAARGNAALSGGGAAGGAGAGAGAGGGGGGGPAVAGLAAVGAVGVAARADVPDIKVLAGHGPVGAGLVSPAGAPAADAPGAGASAGGGDAGPGAGTAKVVADAGSAGPGAAPPTSPASAVGAVPPTGPASAAGPVAPGLPRQAAVVVLKGLSDQLAKRSADVAALADLPGAGKPGKADSDPASVPEPGTLACVLLALVTLIGLRRRQGRGGRTG